MKKTDFLWTFAAESLTLPPDHVDVWRIHLDLPPNVLSRLDATLAEDEKQRSARFSFAEDRKRFITAHGCLREILTRYLPCEPGQFNFSSNSYGKPALRDHELEFNLSHSGDFALIAITRGRRIGVDVERVRSGISSHVIAQQYFSKSEFAELQSLPAEQREPAFFTCWTRKEAYIKAQGLGLSLALDSFDVSLSPDEPAILRATRPDPEEAARWTLVSLNVEPCYEAAVSIEGTNPTFRLWDWNALATIWGRGDPPGQKRASA